MYGTIQIQRREVTTMKKMTYHGREFLFVAHHEAMGESYDEWYCMDTNEGMNIWSDGFIEIFECA